MFIRKYEAWTKESEIFVNKTRTFFLYFERGEIISIMGIYLWLLISHLAHNTIYEWTFIYSRA